MTNNASVCKESDSATNLASLLLLHEPIVTGVLTPNHSVGDYSSPAPATQQRKSSSTSIVFEQNSSDTPPQSQSSNRIRITVPVHMRKKKASPVQDHVHAVNDSSKKKTVRRSGRLKSKETNSNKPARPSTSVDDVSVAVDTSYRYMWQGYGLLVLKVIDLSQTAHSVAWAMVSKEDDDAHVFVFQQFVKELEHLVSRYAAAGRQM